MGFSVRSSLEASLSEESEPELQAKREADMKTAKKIFCIWDLILSLMDLWLGG